MKDYWISTGMFTPKSPKGDFRNLLFMILFIGTS
jgi:hypothetical protein